MSRVSEQMKIASNIKEAAIKIESMLDEMTWSEGMTVLSITAGARIFDATIDEKAIQFAATLFSEQVVRAAKWFLEEAAKEGLKPN